MKGAKRWAIKDWKANTWRVHWLWPIHSRSRSKKIWRKLTALDLQEQEQQKRLHCLCRQLGGAFKAQRAEEVVENEIMMSLDMNENMFHEKCTDVMTCMHMRNGHLSPWNMTEGTCLLLLHLKLKIQNCHTRDSFQTICPMLRSPCSKFVKIKFPMSVIPHHNDISCSMRYSLLTTRGSSSGRRDARIIISKFPSPLPLFPKRYDVKCYN